MVDISRYIHTWQKFDECDCSEMTKCVSQSLFIHRNSLQSKCLKLNLEVVLLIIPRFDSIQFFVSSLCQFVLKLNPKVSSHLRQTSSGIHGSERVNP